MVVSVSAPEELIYRDYENFDMVIFERELEDKLHQQINEYKHFEQTEYPCTNKKETTQS